jgi:hypothetical protein
MMDEINILLRFELSVIILESPTDETEHSWRMTDLS